MRKPDHPQPATAPANRPTAAEVATNAAPDAALEAKREGAFSFSDVDWWAALEAAGSLLMAIARREPGAAFAALLLLAAAFGVRIGRQGAERVTMAAEEAASGKPVDGAGKGV